MISQRLYGPHPGPGPVPGPAILSLYPAHVLSLSLPGPVRCPADGPPELSASHPSQPSESVHLGRLGRAVLQRRRLFGFRSESSTLLVRVNPGQSGAALRQLRAPGRGATAPAVDQRGRGRRSPGRRIRAGHSLRGSIMGRALRVTPSHSEFPIGRNRPIRPTLLRRRHLYGTE
jgi:hypothetical protein